MRLDQRATDAVLAALLGITGAVAVAGSPASPAAAGWAATDGDPATAWMTPFGGAVGARLDGHVAGPITELTLTQPGGDHSPITGLRVTAGAATVDVTVPPPTPPGSSTVPLPADDPAPGEQLEITAVEPHVALDRRYGEPVVLPAAISEVSIGARPPSPTGRHGLPRRPRRDRRRARAGPGDGDGRRPARRRPRRGHAVRRRADWPWRPAPTG